MLNNAIRSLFLNGLASLRLFYNSLFMPIISTEIP